MVDIGLTGRKVLVTGGTSSHGLRAGHRWWARTVSNRRPLVCKATGTSEQAFYDVQYVQFRNSHVFTLFRCVHPVRPCLGNLAAT